MKCQTVIVLRFFQIAFLCHVLKTAAQMAGNGGYRMRSPLARAVMSRLVEDNQHRNDKHEYWYSVDTSKLPAELCDKFVPFHQDEETTEFLDACQEKADWVFTQIFHSLAQSVLAWFMSKTSINGLLGRGSMFVFSHQQFERLLSLSPVRKADNLIDLGAGDGEVTKVMADYFSNVYVTEMSPPMIKLLKNKGYRILDVSSWHEGNITYDVVSCLNLLDRCDKPVSLLHTMRKVLRPDTGRLIVAVVIPFKPYVEFDSEDHTPTEKLIISGATFEEQISGVETRVVLATVRLTLLLRKLSMFMLKAIIVVICSAISGTRQPKQLLFCQFTTADKRLICHRLRVCWSLISFLALPMSTIQRCDRARSRLIRRVVYEKLQPAFSMLHTDMSDTCPFAPSRDRYRIQEQHKSVETGARWTCHFCGKAFVSEYFLDLHFDNRHADQVVAMVQTCVPSGMTQNETAWLTAVTMEELCSYLTCSKYWEIPFEPDDRVGVNGVYVILTVLISAGLIIYYCVFFTYFYTDTFADSIAYDPTPKSKSSLKPFQPELRHRPRPVVTGSLQSH
ncbi:hypothetical protein BaRGS_00004175 [Batillaria attramentaria]|uniref:C2H2-type domain-containing protein n=1 Tax=Batillaria attramentaria TaxID=370345 RepID=A0ABD0LZ20_9CAEN